MTEPLLRMGRALLRPARDAIYWLALPFLVLVQLSSTKRDKTLLLWGPVPITNNKYWSAAMRQAGSDSRTLMTHHYASISSRQDFDLYYDDLVSWAPSLLLRRILGPLAAHLYVTRHASVIHIPFSGGPLGLTALWKIEAWLFRISRVRTVVIPYGADVFMYSRIPDPAVRHALLLSYPDTARREHEVVQHVAYWSRHADVIVIGYTLEGVPRWDVPAGNMVCIDTAAWTPSDRRSTADGMSGTVRIVHTPNHRGAKGTEFLLRSVDELRQEGLDLDLKLLERAQNETVRDIMRESDILADQFVLPGHGLGAIEGMACGLPVMSNLTDSLYTRLFRRYSYLNECPILATTPENLTDNLRILVRNPTLRLELGRAGRDYVEKYHSYAAAQYLFGAIHRQLLKGEDVDLMNLFHPLKSAYNRRTPVIRHPLIENRLPPDYPLQC